MKLLEFFHRVFSFSSHFLFFALIFYVCQPVFKWYLAKVPILGVDFYNSVNYASYLSRHLGLHFNQFADNWFAGYPLYKVFVSPHWYLMVPFINRFGMILGVQYYVLFALFLLVVCCYLLYFQLTKSRALSFLLAFLVLFSVNIYGSFVWGGSLPYFATQFFLPLILIFCDKYVLSGNKRWYFAAILATGFAFLAHPGPAFGFYLPSASILLFFGVRKENKKLISNFFVRFKEVFVFVSLSLLVALPVSYERIIHTFNALLHNGPVALFAFIKPVAGNDPSTGGSTADNGAAAQGVADINNFYKGLTRLLYEDTNQMLFLLLALGIVLFFITFAISRKSKVFLRVFPYLLIAGYSGGHTFLNANGIIFIPQGWYRAFWTFPILVGALAAVCWGEFFELIRSKLRLESKVLGAVFTNIPFVLFSLIFFIVVYFSFTTKVSEIISIIDSKTEISSAHPEALSIRTSEREIELLKAQLLPDFINPSDKNKRLYESDALVNIWWSAFFEMPLARGYVDPPLGISQRGGLFWLDIAVGNDSLVRDFKVPERMAYNNALFLLDWYGIYYYEGGRFGISASAPPSSYLLKNNIFEKEATTEARGVLFKWQTPSGKPELNMDTPQYLKFFKVKDEFTSPILYGSSAPTILVFSDDLGYENVMRGFAAENFNSRYVVPVLAGKYIDDVDDSELSKFDAVILHNYSYHNKTKAFGRLLKFVEKGGKVFIDTGSEGKESQSKDLPELLPFSSSERRGLGQRWIIETSEDALLKGVNTANFGPLIFNDDAWKISYPKDTLEGGAKTILKHEGKPVLVKQNIGSGEVIWSGFNLIYHLNQYKSEDEAKLFTNIISDLVPIAKTEPVSTNPVWQSSEKVSAEIGAGARGIIFKEEYYPGWNIKVKGQGVKGATLYKVGPTYPGFMYAAISKSPVGALSAEFKYRGAFEAYLYYGIALILIVVLLDSSLFGGKLFLKRIHFVKGVTDKKVSSWWEKEDE